MRQRWFTLALVLTALLAGARVARADRVVLLPPRGHASDERLEQVEVALVTALRAVGHEPVGERLAWETGGEPPPETANELRAVAELQGAKWTVVPQVREEDGGGGYWLTLRAGYAPTTRAEEVTAEVRDSREAERLEAILRVLLRPEGLDGDAERVSGEDAVARQAEAEARAEKEAAAEAARKKAEAEAKEREARAKAEAEAKAAAEKEAQARWKTRERYGETAPWMVQLGLGARPIVSHSAGGRGGALGAVEARAGRSFEALPGLEARAGFDLVFGASTAFALYGGAAYLASFFETPVFLGPSLELGLFVPLTGIGKPSFLLRGAPTVAWHFAGQWFVEGALPEVMWLSAGDGAVTVGVSARLGLRF